MTAGWKFTEASDVFPTSAPAWICGVALTAGRGEGRAALRRDPQVCRTCVKHHIEHLGREADADFPKVLRLLETNKVNANLDSLNPAGCSAAGMWSECSFKPRLPVHETSYESQSKKIRHHRFKGNWILLGMFPNSSQTTGEASLMVGLFLGHRAKHARCLNDRANHGTLTSK